MSDTKQIVDRAWSYAHVLRDEGISYLAYIEQITFLLFLKMVDEIAAADPMRAPLIPHQWGWASLIERTGPDLIEHYERVLERLSQQPGMLGAIFRKPRPEIENPRTLRRLIVDLIGSENWSALAADVKGDIYEGLLARTASESPKGAGQYFTPRGLISAIVDCIRPTVKDTVCDPAAGTGGFLLAALEVAKAQARALDETALAHLRTDFAHGSELVPNTARLCIMNLFLHGVDADPPPIRVGVDALAEAPGRRFSVILTNPPFGTKGTARGSEEEDSSAPAGVQNRPDLAVATSNKQLNFLQHAVAMLEDGGRCAIVVPDNVLFEAGAGEAVRRRLLKTCHVHTLLRLPPGIFYAQGVKANVLFFDKRPSTPDEALWVYDLRTAKHFTLRQRPIQRSDFDEFVDHYADGSEAARRRRATEGTSDRWRAYSHQNLLERDKTNLDLSWLREQVASANEASLAAPAEIANSIALDLRAAIERFDAVARRL
ncbi:type I restriction-modification system subunit M [Sphingomonas yunnanensis]|uniref:class I SAM-dependent DNA methyltransferase n=1 Tax=Sphingomonas yunnanensis TaxID=310400 RepID=UPI001CA6D6A9|nr:class I SAM-dependent DNA methyltransferase [Sphingomonas yunnanensis]MBY9064978.1 type I restriction-modification system subunit M [Sphingomonas yunnanensis]